MNTSVNNHDLSLIQQLNPLLVEQAMALIQSAQRIALLAHEHPDGDCLGSALGFAHILRALGKTCVPACADPAPPSFSFFPGVETLQTSLGDEDFDLVIALDAGEFSRFGSLYDHHRTFLDQARIINIDHHISSQGCGQVNIIEPAAAATAELVLLFQRQADLPLNRDAALCLLTGLITDTGSFQYTSTTPRTMRTAAYLIEAGAVADTIVQPIFRSHPLTYARLQAAVVNQARTTYDGRIIWSYATEETLASVGATSDMDNNFSGMLRDIEGVQIGAFFKSYGEPNITRVSLRTVEPYNAATICMRFGGGGHARAAGATINLPIQEAIPLMVAELERTMHDVDLQAQSLTNA